MKFSINRHAFLKQLSDVQKAAATKTTLPILTGIKILLTDTELTLSGSNGDISIERLLKVHDAVNELTVERTGAIVVSSRFFGEIIRKLPGNTVHFDLKENLQLEITAEQAKFNIIGIDASHYPKFPTIDTQNKISIPTILFKRIIGQTIIAASTQETRPILTGVCLTIKNGRLTTVATDSHRLSQRIITLENIDPSFSYTATIPAKSLSELSKILEDTDHVSMVFTDNQMLFVAENLYFYSRLLEGNYPEVSRLISQDSNTTLSINSSAFLDAVDRVSLLSREGKSGTVQLALASNKMLLSSNSPEVGYVEEQLTGATVTGEQLNISFNPQYMKDALKAFGDQDITISFIAHDRPFTLRLKTNAEEINDFVQLITPVRTF